MKKATIRDVAKAAGVSQSTVSRVLNNNGYVGEDARRRVEEAMEALHYSPSAIAVCLSKSRSRMIGVIVPQIFAPFFSQMYYIADRIMERYGYRLLLCNSDESLKREKELIDDLLSYKIAALLIVPVDGDEGSNKEYLDYIRSSGTPVVCVDREIEGIHCDGVYIDNYTACMRLQKTCSRAATATLRIWQTRHIQTGLRPSARSSVTPARNSALRCRRRIFSLRRLKIRNR